MYEAKKAWEEVYRSSRMSYPAEGVIRIFLGQFPELKLDRNFQGKRILDLGYGDGRHFPLFDRLEMLSSGVEISEKIVASTREIDALSHISLDLRAGSAANIPFEDETFDYLLAWNSCYYMGSGASDFERHVEEMARVVRRDGYLVISVPTSNNFIFSSATVSRPGYRTIADDYFGTRNGEEMRCFETKDELEAAFSSTFGDFCHAEIDMKWFGLAYNWFVMVARKL